jgi:hypothetical protein
MPAEIWKASVRRGLGNPRPIGDVTGKVTTISPSNKGFGNYYGKKIPRSGFYNPITGDFKTY